MKKSKQDASPPRKAKRITQSSIAAHLGLTQETVSHALLGTGTLSEGTRTLVKKTAKELGYRPHALARSMQRGRFDSVGMLASTGTHASPLNMQLMRGCYEKLHSYGLNMVFARMPDEDFLKKNGTPRMLSELMVDALLLNLGPDIAPGTLEIVEAGSVPAILINEKQPHNCVYPDEIAAGSKAAEHLCELGHQSVAFLSTKTSQGIHFSSADRQKGCESYLRQRDLPLHLIELPEKSQALRRARVRHQLSAAADPTDTTAPTAFVTAARMDAELVLLEGIQLGLIPARDFSLLCIDFNSEPFGGIQIDYLRTPFYWLGIECAAMAKDIIDNQGNPLPNRCVPYRDYLFSGETCGPAPVKKMKKIGRI